MKPGKTEYLAKGFCDLTLPKSEWTHHAHLHVGLWHLLRYSKEESLDRLRQGINRYNLATGGTNSASEGYHETITRFYVHAIQIFLEANHSQNDIDELAEALIQKCGDKNLPFLYWSKDRLMSTEARLSWVEPDLKPLEKFNSTCSAETSSQAQA